MLEEVEIVNGKVDTQQTNNKDGYSICKFALDSYIEMKQGTQNTLLLK